MMIQLFENVKNFIIYWQNIFRNSYYEEKNVKIDLKERKIKNIGRLLQENI